MAKIKLSPSGKEIECDPSDSVLTALEKNGLALPSNCRAGACGECKIKVLSGEFDQGFILSMALSDSDKDEGYGLMCMARPTSEVLEIEWATADAKPKLFPPTENIPYVVIDKCHATNDMVKLRIKSLGKPMRFWPGQYIQIQDEQGKLPKRAYNMANTPNLDGEITLLITKINEGNTSQWIHDELAIGSTVKVSGPYGEFIGNPSAETPVLCLASGAGIAPILSLASAALIRGGFKHPANVLYTAKTKADLVEEGTFTFLEKKFRNFKFDYTLTEEGEKKLITEKLNELYPNLSEYSLYIAGSGEFVKDCENKVLELGAKKENVHTESFS